MKKRDTYFNISECTEDELEQLKMTVYANDGEYDDFLTEKDKQILENCDIPDKIPYNILEKIFGDISFVDEDFWCNCKEEEEEEEEVKPERKKSDEIDEYYFLILEQFN